jgi:hypothetical protein
LGRTVSLAFNLYRFGWRTFVAISLLLTVPLVIANGITTMLTYDEVSAFQQAITEGGDTLPPFPWSAYLVSFAVTLLLASLGWIANAALVDATMSAISGQRLSVRRSYRAAFSRVGSILALYVAVTVITVGLSVVVGLGPVFLILAPGAVGSGGPFAFGLIVLGVAAFFLAVFVGLRLSLSLETLIVENTPVSTALRRSNTLATGSMWRIAGYVFTFGLILGLIGLGFGILVGIASLPFALHYSPTTGVVFDSTGIVFQEIVTGHAAALFSPIATIGVVLLYLDLRWRRGESVPAPGQPAGR